MLKLKGIKKDYVTASETVNALKGIDISFRRREFVSILGPSGCGKTTLLNIIGGLDHYTEGDLLIGERSTRSYTDRDWDIYRNHRVGFIFQSYNLIPHQTVLGNVELALTIAGVGREERIARAKTALDRVGLAGQYYKKPNQLSGGQCQRVAIARALVNDPEILLADEPTGALDTVTSVQIMDLIKEISEERLVIMVTHNPELAEQYSTRIVRLLDGNLQEDSNPMTEEEEAAEAAELAAEAEAAAIEAAKEAEADTESRAEGRAKKKPSREKAKMSFITAFKLSARNLISKRGRTVMVGFAGSIGIIGIALVLAFSAGIKGYIASMQDDMLSGNPISITETAYDFEALSGMMGEDGSLATGDKEAYRVYISSLISYLAKMNDTSAAMVIENTITKEYIDYVKAMEGEEWLSALIFNYGIDLSPAVYTDFTYTNSTGELVTENISVSQLTAIYTSILKDTEFHEYADYISALVPSFTQAPNSADYILSQYELLGDGEIADEYDEIMLVVDGKDELSDLLLARLGYYSQDEFINLVWRATEDKDRHDPALDRDSFGYDELLGKTFTWYPNDTIYSTSNPIMVGYNGNSAGFDKENSGGVTLRVTGILSPKDDISYGCLTSGVYYTEALADYILDANKDSAIFDYAESTFGKAILEKTYYNIPYEYTYVFDNGDGNTEPKKGAGAVGAAVGIEDILASMIGGSEVDLEDMREGFYRALGGNVVRGEELLPNEVLIYPASFDDKDKVTDYLRAWNDSPNPITVDGVQYTKDERQNVEFTDTIGIIINLLNTMIDLITIGLTGFTSVSLVVSTVMIGIITYVSVVERIKEIGVIRSLGGRKRDVSYLFNAETFIIGSMAGLFGVGATYLISLIVNLALKPLIGYGSIAALPIGQAGLLVLLSIGLTLISGLIPARSAANKDPVVALRTE